MNNNESVVTNEAEVNKTKKPQKKGLIIGGVFAVIIIAVALVLTLVCFHDWQEATCVAPITCSKCGKTEGEALPHEWQEATCKEPKTCKTCGLTEGEPLNEEDFLRDLAKGLEARWVLTDEDEEKETLTEADWEEYFNAEYDVIIKYEKANFKNKTMRKLARKYVESIIESKECLAYFGTNQWTSKYSNGVYNKRVELLYKINAIIPIPVSKEKNQN